MNEWWNYHNLKPAPEDGYNWHPAGRGEHPDDNIDYHIDLGAGRLPKGRLTIDRHGNADILMDLNTMELFDSHGPLEQHGKQLPFPDNSIESIITHHFMEHLTTEGFMRLMDEVYRVLKPRSKFRIIVPLFPSLSAISDPDHKKYFCKDTFDSFCGTEQNFWSDSFAERYTKARFTLRDKMVTPAQKFRHDEMIDIDKLFQEPREIRVTLEK